LHKPRISNCIAFSSGFHPAIKCHSWCNTIVNEFILYHCARSCSSTGTAYLQNNEIGKESDKGTNNIQAVSEMFALR